LFIIVTKVDNVAHLCHIEPLVSTIEGTYMRKAPESETSRERFARLATARTNQVLRDLRVLGNCANRQSYVYTKRDVDTIFAAIDRRVKETKSKFQVEDADAFRLPEAGSETK